MSRPVRRRTLPPLLAGLFLFLAGALLFSGCGAREEATAPAHLRVGVLPDTRPEELQRRHASLVRHLSETLKMPCDLIIPASYDQLVEDIAAGRIDVALLGGYTYVLARDLGAAIPLVMRDVDRHFTSVFLTSPRHAGRSLESFKGMRFAFGAELSTSGHLLPRHFLERRGIKPEAFFSEVRYSGAHDRTAQWIRDGEADLGAANASVIETLLHRGDLKEGDVVLLEESPSYVDYVWAARAALPASLRTRIRTAFLSLTMLDSAHVAVLSDQGANGYLPALDADFDTLTAIVRQRAPAAVSKTRKPGTTTR